MRDAVSLFVVLALIAISACGSSRDPYAPPPGGSSGAGGGELFDAGLPTGPPPADAGGLCGNQIHQVVTDAPNIYFVLDASGSMSAQAGTSTRYQSVRGAALDMVRKLGPLINVGAALFPLGAKPDDPCHVGGEVLSIRPGDPISDKLGPTAFAFSESTIVDPAGGTPITATLNALAPKLSAASGRTIVVLATDGGPNCNINATCGADECMSNIDGTCDSAENCCAPGKVPGPESCIDRQPAVDAVSSLAASGVPVYVVGTPGSEIYGDVLDALALAGNAPQLAPPFYYKVDDYAELGVVLGSIAARVISCEFDLVDPPPDGGNTNVYFDKELVPYDAMDGWTWKTPSVIELVGDACVRLKNAEVRQVQIVSGCPTEATK